MIFIIQRLIFAVLLSLIAWVISGYAYKLIWKD